MCMTTLKQTDGINWSFKKESTLYLPYGYNYVFVQSVGNKTTTKRMYHSQKAGVGWGWLTLSSESRGYTVYFSACWHFLFFKELNSLCKTKTKKNQKKKTSQNTLFKNKYKKTFQNSWKVLEHFGIVSESGSACPPILVIMPAWSRDPKAWWPAVIRAMK